MIPVKGDQMAKLNMETLMVLFIGVILFGSFIGMVADSTIGINTTDTNVTGATHTLVVLVPLIFAIVFILLMVGLIKRK